MKWFVIAALVLAGCLGTGPESEQDNGNEPQPANGTGFLIIGDGGTGGEAQYRVAAAMEAVCSARNCSFVLGLGDNIYENGVSSSMDEQFNTKFELPYANFSIPFYMVLGNHDNGGGNGRDASVADYQVEYHYREDRPSDKWQMPDRYYSFDHGPLRFIGLDSGPQSTNEDPAYLEAVHPQVEEQRQFLQTVTPSNWTFAMFHHPYISNGQHANAGAYDGIPYRGLGWKTFVEEEVCPKVDMIFAGHDHDLQWLEPVSTCGDTEFIISGAAGKTRTAGPQTNAAYFEAYSTFGFWWASVEDDTFTAIAYDDEANELFSRTWTKA